VPSPEQDRVAADPVNSWVASKSGRDGGKSAWQQEVVAIKESRDFACRLTHSLVDRIHLPAIRLADPKREAVVMAAQDVDAPVLAATVDDYVFNIGVILIAHRLKRRWEEWRLVIGRRDDRYANAHNITSAVSSR
jgi:hypothetical protein